MNQDKPSPGVVAYLFGVLLAFAACTLVIGRTFSTHMTVIVSAGMMLGLCPFVAIGPIHFLFQKGVVALVRKFDCPSFVTRRIGLLINLPAAVLVLTLVASAALPPTRAAKQRMFELITKERKPGSVEIIGYEFNRGLNEGSSSFAFTISDAELDQLISNLALTNATTDIDPKAIGLYRLKLAELGAADFSLESPITAYEGVMQKGVTEYRQVVVVGKNRQEALLLHSFH